MLRNFVDINLEVIHDFKVQWDHKFKLKRIYAKASLFVWLILGIDT